MSTIRIRKAIHLAAEETGGAADQRTDHKGDANDGEGAQQRNSAAVQDTGKQVTAKFVRTEDVQRIGAGEPVGNVQLGHVFIAAQNRGSQHRQEHESQQEHAEHGQLVLAEAEHDQLAGAVFGKRFFTTFQHTLCPPSGCQVNSGVNHRAQQVYQKIDHANDHRHEDDRAQHHGNVPGFHGT